MSGFVLMLPFMEDQAFYDQFDIDHGDGIWPSSASNLPNWHTPAKDKAIATRPGFVVCPSSLTLPQTEITEYQDKADIPATGTYAFPGGHRGINKFGVTGVASLVKHHNTGMHLYWTHVKLKKITDGTSKTISVGEIVDGHTRDSSNIWTMTLRFADYQRR